MLLEPGEVHVNTRVYAHCEFRVLCVDPQLAWATAQELGLPAVTHFPRPKNEDPALFRALEDLCTAMEEGAPVLEQQSRLSACLYRTLAFAEMPPPPLNLRHARKSVERARRHLLEHFDEPVTLAELVTLTGLSRFHLTRAFAQQVGVPPHKYQTLVRVQHAATLLRRGTPPHIAAAEVGFADQSHLTRCFRRLWRVTPALYARG
jgi:AraC-like DNA-binding protein